MFLVSLQLPVVLLDGSVGAITFFLQLLAGVAALALSGLVGLLVAFGVALDLKASVRREILCVVLAAIHLAIGVALRGMTEGWRDPIDLPSRISLFVGPLVLSGVIIGRIRRRLRRP